MLRIHDCEEAAVLYAAGFQPTACEWSGPRMYFLFPDTPHARTALGKFAAGDLHIDPRAILAGFREARKRLWREKREADELR